MSGLELDREAVRRALAEHGLGADDLPLLVELSGLDAGVRLSALLVMLVDAAEGSVGRGFGSWVFVGVGRLPWAAESATAAVRAVIEGGSYDDRRVDFALRGAAQVCAAGHADVWLLDALSALRDYLGWIGTKPDRILEMRALVGRCIASGSPPGRLDLSALVDGDTWAPAARAAAYRLAGQQDHDVPDGEGSADASAGADVAPLVRLLVTLGPRRPTTAWRQATRRALRRPTAQTMLREWLHAASIADVVPEEPGGSLRRCRGVLFVEANVDVVRAAVWASLFLPDDQWTQKQPAQAADGLGFDVPGATPGESGRPWPADLLGVLARRGSAHNGLSGFPEALALKVATASVDVLISHDGRAEREVLAELLEDLQRRDVLKKIGTHLGRAAEVDQRVQKVTKQRAVDQRARASPAPRKARAARESMLRTYVGPTLRALGFVGGPTIWRRATDDQVDEITFSAGVQSDGQNRIHLDYGAYFIALTSLYGEDDDSRVLVGEDNRRGRHLSVSETDEVATRAPVGRDSLDAFSPDGLAALTERLTDVVVPFLTSLKDYKTVLAVLEADIGLPPGSAQGASPGSFSRHEIAGSLALAHGDRTTAVAHLDAAIELAWTFQESEFGDGWASHALGVVTWRRGQAESLP